MIQAKISNILFAIHKKIFQWIAYFFNWFLHCVICEEIKGGFVVASIFLTCIVFYKFVVNFKIRMYKKNK